jgi:uncharacterized protein YktB (UPF0637 family)
MEFLGFSDKDFDVFSIDGLEPRMDALKETIRPKLEALGSHFTPTLANLTGEEMFPHVARHARRTINPPKDTWVAFASNARGYKMLPHFQIGLWETHLFIWYAVIYEAPQKEEIGKYLEKNIDAMYKGTPSNFVWSTDHTKPEVIMHSDLSKPQLLDTFKRLQTVKKAEILCGYQIKREKVTLMSPKELITEIESVFRQLIPLYKKS